MRIAVNTRLLLSGRLEGIGWFTFESLKRITQAHPEHEFIFLFDRKFDPQFVFSDNVTPVVIGPQARHPVLFKWWFNRSVKRALKKHKADLFFSPDGYLSLTTDCPQVAVIHDLNFEHYPDDLPKHVIKYYQTYFPQFARKAARVITVSEYSKQDIHTQYGVDLDLIDVVYNGVNEKFGPAELSRQQEVREELCGGHPYFIFVGSLHPRKNISRLVEAFNKMKVATGCAHRLVLVGNKMWWNDEMERQFQALEHKDHVVFAGSIPGDKLSDYISSAEAMTFVPYFEGFGIPILEAFACRTLLITSNITSMPEVAGNAGVLVDPFSVEEISNAMISVVSGQIDKEEQLRLGTERLKHFSWDQTADRVWKSLEKVLEEL